MLHRHPSRSAFIHCIICNHPQEIPIEYQHVIPKKFGPSERFFLSLTGFGVTFFLPKRFIEARRAPRPLGPDAKGRVQARSGAEGRGRQQGSLRAEPLPDTGQKRAVQDGNSLGCRRSGTQETGRPRMSAKAFVPWPGPLGERIRKASGASSGMHAKTASEHLAPFSCPGNRLKLPEKRTGPCMAKPRCQRPLMHVPRLHLWISAYRALAERSTTSR